MNEVIRVFPRKTSFTPIDDYAFVGYPGLWRPSAQTVLVSVCFTWDIQEGYRLEAAWSQYYPDVRLGGPAFDSPTDEFEAGRFVKPGVIFTSRGCPRACGFCLVSKREGPLKELGDFAEGHIIADNNFLACSDSHRRKVYQMLSRQPRAAIFSGGIQASLVTDEIAEEFRGLRIDSLFLAADTEGALKPLAKAIRLLSFLPRRKLRCYVLCGFNGETIDKAKERLERVWELGALPFAMLYQPPEKWIKYGPEWRALAREWTRPAAMFAAHKEKQP